MRRSMTAHPHYPVEHAVMIGYGMRQFHCRTPYQDSRKRPLAQINRDPKPLFPRKSINLRPAKPMV